MPSPRSRIAPYFSGRLRMFRISCVCLQADGSTASRSNHSLHRPVHTQVLQDPQRISFLRLDPLSTISRQGLPQQYPTSPDQEEEVGSPRRRQIQKSNDLRSRCATVLQKFRMLQSPPRPLAPPHRRKPQLCVLVWIHPVDREILWPRVLAKHPFQPLDIPFPYEDVFDSTCAAFASACLTRSTSRSGRENKNTTLGAYTQTLGVHHIHLGLRNFSAHQTIVSLPCFPIRPRIRNLGTRLHSRRWTMNSSPSPSPCFRSLRRLYFLSL